MGGKLKRLFSMAMSLTLMVSAVGCSDGGTKKSEMGRYVEERYESPTDSYIQNMTKLDDGRIAMVGQTYDTEVRLSSFISEDGGQTWSETIIDLPKQDGMETSIMNSTVLSDGRILIGYYFMEPWVEPEVDENGNIAEDESTEILDKEEWKEPEYKYAIVNQDGTFQEIEIEQEEAEDGMWYGQPQFKAASNGDIFYSTGKGDSVVQLDGTTFEVKNEYFFEDYFNDYSIVGDSLIIYGFSTIVEFDINTGDEKGNLEELEKEVLGDTVQYYPTFIDSGSKTKLYYYTTLGLYEYDLSEKKTKQLIDGALSSFGDTEMYLMSFVEKDNNEFLTVFNDWSNGGTAIINFAYDANIPSVPDKQLRVYSLLENDQVRQAVSSYAKANPDTYVKYEIGMSWGEEGITESDALKTLNTEIAAGNGPDVILLDGLPVESYIEKGLLEDISDVISEYTNQDLLFKNIADAYTVDGKIYQFPTKVKFPMLVGNKDVIESVSDLDSFVELAKKLGKENPDKRIFNDYYSPKTLVYSLYYLYGNDWLNSDKTINVDALNNFFEKSKELYTVVDENMKRYYEKMEAIWNDKFQGEQIPDKEEIIEDEDFEEGDGEDFVDPNEGIWSVYEINNYLMPSVYADSLLMDGNDAGSLIYGGLDSSWGYQSLITALINNKDLDYKMLARGDEKVFMPIDLLGVNSKAKNKEEAKEFIKELFNEKSQTRYYGQGITVNKESLKKEFAIDEEWQPEFDEETQHYFGGTMGWQDEDGTMHEIKQYLPNEEDINRLIGEIESLNVAGTVNRVLLTEVAKQFEAYALGNSSLDDAINTIVDNLDLYLAE